MRTSFLPYTAFLIAGVLAPLALAGDPGTAPNLKARSAPSEGVNFIRAARSLRDIIDDIPADLGVPVTLVTRATPHHKGSVWDDTATRGEFPAPKAQYLIWWVAHFGGGTVWQENGSFIIADEQEAARPGWTRFRLDEKDLQQVNAAIEKSLDEHDSWQKFDDNLANIIDNSEGFLKVPYIVDPRLAKSNIFFAGLPPLPTGNPGTIRSVLQNAMKVLGCSFEVKWGAVYIFPGDAKQDAKAAERGDNTNGVGAPLVPVAQSKAQDTGEQGANAVRAELGRFLLIKRIDGVRVALKLTEHTRPAQKSVRGMNLGAKYVCYVFPRDGGRPEKFEGEVYEPDGGGVGDHIFIYCDSFRLDWSLGDWIYFTEAMTAMAQSKEEAIEKVDFNDKALKWIPYVPPWKRGGM